MCNLIGGVITTVVGLVLVGVSCYLGFGLVPNIVDDIIRSEVQLINDTEQMNRFEEVPFALTFNVRVFNITNPDQVLQGGVPVVKEIGPYVYTSRQLRVIEEMNEDNITYRRMDLMEFDEQASYPYTTDDRLTIVNVPYHGILQTAERMFPNLMGAMAAALNGIFGENNGPIMTVRVGDLLFDGIPICKNPGIIGGIACMQIRSLAANVRNIEEKDDGSLEFTLLRYKNENPSHQYVVNRGTVDALKLGIISSYNGSAYLGNWNQDTEAEEFETNVCNKIRGTDSGVFPPFVNRSESIYALNMDICRSVELRYEGDTSYEGIPAARFAANEWLLDNNEGCYCLNTTTGITAENGCLLHGAMELYSCVGAFLVLTYPHFLFADFRYRNGIIGVSPSEDEHKIFVELEPRTGTVVRGMKRAQFNIFMRQITSIPATQNLRTTLTPLVWVEEGMSLPDEYVDMLKTRLLQRLRLVDILIPVIIAVCCLVVVIGVAILIRSRSVRKKGDVTNGRESIRPAT
ncbi:sensory neuron membrane protein 2-like [Vanessa tameamea]|uniref:Sensory neuron membrane protein 2 n=1 Tax=Vanessa tameamea TaxID=334116 RepID=A0A8B8IU39_VANTA|nr:sensory neuron membrane protein 2-like [Vanessa tameamea]